MTLQNENPAQGGAGLGYAFPGGDNSESSQKPARVQEAFAFWKRDFVAECLRIVAIKSAHGADNAGILDDITAEKDIEFTISHLREAARAFRELQRLIAENAAARQVGGSG